MGSILAAVRTGLSLQIEAWTFIGLVALVLLLFWGFLSYVIGRRLIGRGPFEE